MTASNYIPKIKPQLVAIDTVIGRIEATQAVHTAMFDAIEEKLLEITASMDRVDSAMRDVYGLVK